MRALPLAVDATVMLDQSGSMADSVTGGGNKWDATVAALSTVVNRTYTSPVNMSLSYFGLPSTATCAATFCGVDADCGGPACGPCFSGICLGNNAGDSCVAADYATPAVGMAALPGNASPIISSLGTHGPSTGTPTAAALQGAMDAATAHAALPEAAGHVASVFLLTDGVPSVCDTQPATLEAIAHAGLMGPAHVLTFVVGIGTDVATNLDGLAAAGGTDHAYSVSITNPSVPQQVNLALQDALTHSQCTLRMPDPTQAAPSWRLRLSNATQVIEPTRLPDSAGCAGSMLGWYQDASGATAVMCPLTCGQAASGTVEFVTGCL